MIVWHGKPWSMARQMVIMVMMMYTFYAPCSWLFCHVLNICIHSQVYRSDYRRCSLLEKAPGSQQRWLGGQAQPCMDSVSLGVVRNRGQHWAVRGRPHPLLVSGRVHWGLCWLRQKLLLDKEHVLHSDGYTNPHRPRQPRIWRVDLLPVGALDTFVHGMLHILFMSLVCIPCLIKPLEAF